MSLNRKLKGTEKIINSLALKTEREIMKNYARQLRGMRSKLAYIFDKYFQEGKLDYSEIQKYGRLSKLERDIIQEVMKLYDDDGKLLRETLTEVYNTSYYRTAWAIETETRARLGYSAVDLKTVQLSIQNPFTGLTLNERLERHRTNLIYSLKEELTRGFVNGDTYPQISRRVKDLLEGDASKAIRIVRTESTRIYNEAQYDSILHAEEQGIIMTKTWISSRDDRTRESHEMLDGVTIPVDEPFVIDGDEGMFPGDFSEARNVINCRCTVEYNVVAINKPTHDELGDMSFDDWMNDRLH